MPLLFDACKQSFIEHDKVAFYDKRTAKGFVAGTYQRTTGVNRGYPEMFDVFSIETTGETTRIWHADPNPQVIASCILLPPSWEVAEDDTIPVDAFHRPLAIGDRIGFALPTTHVPNGTVTIGQITKFQGKKIQVRYDFFGRPELVLVTSPKAVKL